MKMVNMKRPPAKPSKAEPTMGPDEPRYPWGLELTLDNDSLEKLGMKDLPESGTVMMVTAKATVSRTSSTDTKGGKNQSLSLQITDLACEEATAKKPASETLYKG